MRCINSGSSDCVAICIVCVGIVGVIFFQYNREGVIYLDMNVGVIIIINIREVGVSGLFSFGHFGSQEFCRGCV